MSTEEQLFSAVKFFTYVGSKTFLEYAKRIVEISLRESPAEGLSGPLCKAVTGGTTVVGGGVGAIITGGLAGIGPGSKIGKVSGDLANKGISYILQIKERGEAKKIHNSFFEGLDKAQEKVVERFFYEVYQNYNPQFWGMLGSSSTYTLVDSVENSLSKIALDIVHRIFEYLRDDTKKKTKGSGRFTRQDLIEGLEWGKSDISGKIKHQCLRIHKGRTIKFEGGEFNTKFLLEGPYLIKKDLDVDGYKEAPTSAKKYYYRYAFPPNSELLQIAPNKQVELADELKKEAKIHDVYCLLKDNREQLLKNLKELKPLQLGSLERALEELHNTFEKTLKETETRIKDQTAQLQNHMEKQLNEMNIHTVNEINEMFSTRTDDVVARLEEKRCSVVLIGDTGFGKSSIACYLSNTTEREPFEVSHEIDPTTNGVVLKQVKVFQGSTHENEMNTKMTIIDTPGLGGTAKRDGQELTDDVILSDIEGKIRTYGDKQKHANVISAFLLVLDGSSKIPSRTLKYFKKFDGPDKVFSKHLIVIFNRIDSQQRLAGKRSEFSRMMEGMIDAEFIDEAEKKKRKSELENIPFFVFNNLIKIYHKAGEKKPLEQPWGKGVNLEQAKKLIKEIRAKNDTNYHIAKDCPTQV